MKVELKEKSGEPKNRSTSTKSIQKFEFWTKRELFSGPKIEKKVDQD